MEGLVTSDSILNTEPGSVTGTLNALALAVACAVAEEAAHSTEYLDSFIEANSDFIQYGLLQATKSSHYMIAKLLHGESDDYVVANIIAKMPPSAYPMEATFCLAKELVATEDGDLDYFFGQIFDQVARDPAVQAAVVGLIVLIFLTLRYGAEEGLQQFLALSAGCGLTDDADTILEQLSQSLTAFENRLLFGTLSSFEEGTLSAGVLDPEELPRLLSVIDPFSSESIAQLRDS